MADIGRSDGVRDPLRHCPDKLYSSVMACGTNEYYSRAMDMESPFQIEAFNENGISDRTSIVKSD